MTSLKAKYLEGRYDVLGELAGGGMGSLYVVRHRKLDEMRVVKVLHRQLAGKADYTARFEAEALAGARLRQHPNVVQIFDFLAPDPAADRPGLIIMELIHGVNLKRLIAGEKRPSLPLGLEIARQSVRALAHLHELGFVHRDVSPNNLMLTRSYDGQPLVKMIDLGIAKRLDDAADLTSEGTFIGQVRYSSPERFEPTRELDARSDVYSFGVVLYELLTGVYPIVGNGLIEIARSHCETPPRPFSDTDTAGRVPEELRQLILRALAKKPEDRPGSALAFAAAIEGLRQRHPMTRKEVEEAEQLLSDAETPFLDLNPSPRVDPEKNVPPEEKNAAPEESPMSATISRATFRPSPFVVGQPIGCDEDLFGRDQEKDLLRDIVERGQMAQILGERLMGKTSLLRWVERNAPRWQDRRVVRIDAEGLPGYSSEKMVLAVAKALGAEDQASEDLDRLGGGSRAAAQVLSDLMPLVLLVDAADALAQQGHDFDSDFLGALRALGEDGALLWISASRQDLQVLFREAARRSRFLNNSRQVWVGQLEDDAARRLVGPLGETVAVEEALARAGGFAYGLQKLADQMWRSPDDLEAASDAYASQIEPTFFSWWNGRDAEEHMLLKRCAREYVRRSDLDRRERLQALRLTKSGLLKETGDCLVLPGSYWHDFVDRC